MTMSSGAGAGLRFSTAQPAFHCCQLPGFTGVNHVGHAALPMHTLLCLQLDGRRISVTRAVPQSETAPGTPADALRRGQFVPRDAGRQSRCVGCAL